MEKDDKNKTPFYVQNKKESYLAVAGIWQEWFDTTLNQNIVTVALITCDANEKLGEIHHRMPVVLEKKDFSTWLYSPNLVEVNTLFKIYKSEDLKLYEVSSEVNKVLFNEPSCIEELKREPKGQLSLF